MLLSQTVAHAESPVLSVSPEWACSHPSATCSGSVIHKEAQPVRHGCCTYRLETVNNWEVYEGIRFGFVQIRAAPSSQPWHITAFRVVRRRDFAACAVRIPRGGARYDEMRTSVCVMARLRHGDGRS